MVQDVILEGEKHFNEGRGDLAEACFLKVLVEDPANAEALNNLGALAYHRERWLEALSFFTRALDADPYHRQAVINGCELLILMGQPSALLELLDGNLERDPGDDELKALRERCLAAETTKAPEQEA